MTAEEYRTRVNGMEVEIDRLDVERTQLLSDIVALMNGVIDAIPSRN
jgi:hypothetical protein